MAPALNSKPMIKFYFDQQRLSTALTKSLINIFTYESQSVDFGKKIEMSTQMKHTQDSVSPSTRGFLATMTFLVYFNLQRVYTTPFLLLTETQRPVIKCSTIYTDKDHKNM